MISSSVKLWALSWRLFRWTIGSKYRNSFLGYVWVFVPALLVTGGVTLAARAGVFVPGATALPYALHAFIGTLIWQVFADVVDVPRAAFDGARSYLTRVNFPRSAIVLAQLMESLIVLVVRAAVSVLLLGFVTGWSGHLAWVLVGYSGALVLGLGVGLLIAPFLLLIADLQHSLRIALNYGMFATTAVYVPSGNGVLAELVRLNPVSVLMDSSRELVLGASLPGYVALSVTLAGGVLLAALGFGLLKIAAPIFIERMLMGGR